MKKTLLSSLLLIGIFQGFSQTKGLSYQAVILNPTAQEIPGMDASGNILVNSKVVIQFTIVDATGSQEYQEIHSTTTDPYGMVNLMIGSGNATSSTAFNAIAWNGLSKKLKVAIDFSGGGFDFVPLTEQTLSYIPQPANEETITLIAKNATATALNTEKTGITPTQADAITTNTAKISLTTAQITVLGNTNGINTGDQDISGIAANAAAITTLGAGTTGLTGADGASAYQLAFAADNSIGTESVWLASLAGAQGIQGVTGSQGIQGLTGTQGAAGSNGTNGTNG
ncbi:MAG: collagen-like protein, partial [Polaribacter sp.]|nr:collagen-like protein [Polaribacter sp.]